MSFRYAVWAEEEGVLSSVTGNGGRKKLNAANSKPAAERKVATDAPSP